MKIWKERRLGRVRLVIEFGNKNRDDWHKTKEYSVMESYTEKLLSFDMENGYGRVDEGESKVHGEALKLLDEFFAYYERCKLSKKIRIYPQEHHYYAFLPRARIFHTQLMKNNLIRAVHELYDAIDLYPALQVRVHSALMTSWRMYKKEFRSEFDVMT